MYHKIYLNLINQLDVTKRSSNTAFDTQLVMKNIKAIVKESPVDYVRHCISVNNGNLITAYFSHVVISFILFVFAVYLW